VKTYFIALLIVAVIFLGSVIYKNDSLSILNHYPIQKLKTEKENPRIYLIFCFSVKNCLPCLEVIETLNKLPNQLKVIGLVPETELKFEAELRKITGARFELKSCKRYKKYLPNYAPSLFGINHQGKIFFILPGVPGEDRYLGQFLESFLNRANSLLANPK
jgi:hypothetical protein